MTRHGHQRAADPDPSPDDHRAVTVLDVEAALGPLDRLRARFAPDAARRRRAKS
ncbi:MAG: hypothetical protein M3237_09440 [Actinomycetota bacterium]|nr:hypothetical protein [Actinomycetota bacterium]